MVLRGNSSDDDGNITLGMFGEYCDSVQGLPVVCEKNKGNIFYKNRSKKYIILIFTSLPYLY